MEIIMGLSAPFSIKVIKSVVEIVPFFNYEDANEITKYFWNTIHTIQSDDNNDSIVEFCEDAVDVILSLTLLYFLYGMPISDSIPSIQLVWIIGIIFRFAYFLHPLVSIAEDDAL